MIMKKLAIFVVLTLIGTLGFSQSNKVVSAYNYHKSGKLDKAKEAIDEATINPKTMSEAKTWFYRGNIYIDIYRSDNPDYKKLDPDALNTAYEAYKKATELDTKGVYKEDINRFMPIIGQSYFNEGANKYNQGMTAMNEKDTVQAIKEFKVSETSFENAYTIYKESGIVDTATIYYVSIAAELAKDYDKAKETLTTLVEMNYPEPGIYSALAGIYYKQDKNIEKAMQYYKLGRQRYPDDLNLILQETNLFLAENQTEKALANLQLAATKDTMNPTIFFAIGAKYNEIADDSTRADDVRKDAFEKAASAYKQSIALKPDYFDPNYNMGALYVNKAAAIMGVANQLPLDKDKEYSALKKDADKYLSECLPYLEKAHELEPTDKGTMGSLKEIYTRLNMLDKLKAINEELNK